MLDVYILPLRSELEESSRSGFLAASPTKKVARQRKKDQLFFHLTFQGSKTLPPDKHALLLQRLSEVYYKTPGTTTGALRAVAESLNQFLFERNARLQSEEDRSVGYLTQIVQHAERLTIAQSGLSHLYWIRYGGAEHFYDPDLAGMGLGSAKYAKVRFIQGEVQSGDTLLVFIQLLIRWKTSFLASLHGQDVEILRQKLSNETETEGWAIQFRAGSGKVHQLSVAPEPTTFSATSTATTPLSPKTEEKTSPPHEELEVKTYSSNTPLSTAIDEESTLHLSSALSPNVKAPSSPPPELSPKAIPRTTTEAPPMSAKNRNLSFLDGLGNALSNATKRLSQELRRLLSDSGVFQIPTSIMAIIAILVPLVVVSLASVVYFRQGQVGEFERYLALAEQAAQQAQEISDPLAQRSAWEATLAYVDRALVYSNSSEAQALRAQAYAAIDQLESIKRLDYGVAMDDLPKGAQIVKIAVTENELFLLDANSGIVWRADAAARGYVVNANASCGPGIQGAGVGKLVGFGLNRKPTQLHSTIVGLDAMGNVVTCDDSLPPIIESLTPDERGMGTLRGFVIDRGNSYVLDPEKNAVWIYWKNDYTNKPELFFSEDVPPMETVIDFAVYGEDLYLLHTDGHVAQCTYNAEAPTRCIDPLPYRDSRPGRENQLLQSETPFTRLYISQPPDPALYLLDPNSAAIYQFSLRSLAFHTQFRSIPTPSISTLPQGVPATAIAVSSEQRLVFLAFGNRLYYANLP
ncbi:MAG: hypothetical protein N3D16_00605 [Anaerolineales bacterium]|nr:hypothetical protein [Anaerolineales bacterium]